MYLFMDISVYRATSWKLEIPEGWGGGQAKKPSVGRGGGIFLEQHINSFSPRS